MERQNEPTADSLWTDVAERLYATVQQAGHGGEDLAVVARVIETLNGS